ncbi:hypothetical protein [Dactylosporangium salmoneum]|uniref:Uncharacterized protein n=1 Tax=Dactylosporangium salmoneum TaxID=53361 RepID=A0ABN3GAK7_9ACTN
MIDIYGRPLFSQLEAEQIRDMMFPVRCTCGRIYDLAKVEVTARYADCTLWKAPCCGRQADDRGETGWKTTQDYYRIDKGQVQW